MKRRNEEYKITHRWSQREPQITETLKSAKEKGMSYGQYVAMKKAGYEQKEEPCKRHAMDCTAVQLRLHGWDDCTGYLEG